MHVLQTVACGGERDAIDEVALEYSLGLVQAGASVTTVARLPPHRMAAHEGSGARLEHEAMLHSTLAAANPFAVLRHHLYMRREGVRAVIIHTGKAYPLMRLATPRGVPLISVCHGPNFRLRLGADILVCLNAAQEQQLRDLLGTRAARKTFLRLANPSVLPASAAARPPAEGLLACATRPGVEVTLGFLGQLKQSKGLFLVLDALAALVAEGRNMRLLVGGTGPDGEAFQARVNAMGLSERVEMLGWVDDRAAFFERIQIFVCPSLLEPFGMVAAQAMHFGVPVIASDAAGFLEQLRAGETGFIVPRGDAAAIAQAVRGALAAPDAALAMAMAAQAEATRRGDPLEVARTLLAAVEAWREAQSVPKQRSPASPRPGTI